MIVEMKLEWQQKKKKKDKDELRVFFKLKSIFDKIDVDKDGKISKKEFTDAMTKEHKLCLDIEDIYKKITGYEHCHYLFKQLDSNCNSKITFCEFLECLGFGRGNIAQRVEPEWRQMVQEFDE